MQTLSKAQAIHPFKFKSNRIKRLYQGGSGINRLRMESAVLDTNFPEDWIASCVEANSREFVASGYGLSTCEYDGREYLFPQLLQECPEAMSGAEHVTRYGPTPGVLTKLLDSAVLLPLQVHPDCDCSSRYFDSEYGKTEAWIILETREINGEKPYLLLGFNDRLNPEIFRQEVLNGEFHEGLSMLHKIEVKPGDVFVVYGRMPHAIGPGITMVEVMEPTDYVIIPEKNCFGKLLTPEKRFAGLTPEAALDIFDYTVYSREEIVARCAQNAEIIEEKETGILRRLIARRKVKFFEVQELSIAGKWNFNLQEKTFRIGIVVKGEIEIVSGDRKLSIKTGESFFLPFALNECVLTGSARVIIVLPPTDKRDDL